MLFLIFLECLFIFLLGLTEILEIFYLWKLLERLISNTYIDTISVQVKTSRCLTEMRKKLMLQTNEVVNALVMAALSVGRRVEVCLCYAIFTCASVSMPRVV
jgi:hypothetical protein